jgi:galactonate dehydratase
MRIRSIETFLVPPRWLFCRVETDDGVVGWGEPVIEGRAATVRTAVQELAEGLIGADPLRTEDHWQTMTKAGFYRGGPILASAVAGLDQALWDIAGKVHGVPVHELLGGPVRERMRMYGWVGGDDPSAVAEAAAAQVELGLTAVKMNASGRMAPLATQAGIAEVIDRAEAVRAVLGPDRDFAVDFHGRVGRPNVERLLVALEETAPMFVEEPLVPELADLPGALLTRSTIPLALGERLYSRQEFLRVLQRGVTVVQPDLSHAGGITEVRKIASLADTFGALLAPHCPLGPISLAAALQVDFATPNAFIQEQSLGIHYNQNADLLDYLVDTSVLKMRDGYIDRLTGPGLGIEVDEAAVRAADAVGHQWRTPAWRHGDGSFAEW